MLSIVLNCHWSLIGPYVHMLHDFLKDCCHSACFISTLNVYVSDITPAMYCKQLASIQVVVKKRMLLAKIVQTVNAVDVLTSTTAQKPA